MGYRHKSQKAVALMQGARRRSVLDIHIRKPLGNAAEGHRYNSQKAMSQMQGVRG